MQKHFAVADADKVADRLEAITDVLVVGGGLAGGWAATAAARGGASVVLVDKGYFGTSGVTATAGPGHWWVPPDPSKRAAAIEDRMGRAFLNLFWRQGEIFARARSPVPSPAAQDTPSKLSSTEAVEIAEWPPRS
jgi:glycine/D-amino acid oxidase-like deaminating enzyme